TRLHLDQGMGCPGSKGWARKTSSQCENVFLHLGFTSRPSEEQTGQFPDLHFLSNSFKTSSLAAIPAVRVIVPQDRRRLVLRVHLFATPKPKNICSKHENPLSPSTAHRTRIRMGAAFPLMR